MEIRLVLRDKRTGKCFSGGRADKLFSHWVVNVDEAKLFRDMAAVQKTLQELVRRNEENGVEKIAATPGLQEIPPYQDDSYETFEVFLKPSSLTSLQ